MQEGQSPAELARLLCALSFATGLGLGSRIDHGLKTAYIGLQIAERLHLPASEREAAYYGGLLKDVGCTACAAGFAPFFPDDELVPRLDFMTVDPARVVEVLGWLSRVVPVDGRLPGRVAKLLAFVAQCGPVLREALRGHCEVAEQFARRLHFPAPVQRSLRFQWERWDGKGLGYGLRGDEVPLAARILHAAQMLELVHDIGGPEAAQALARQQSGRRFDPEVADAFLALAGQSDFWDVLAAEAAGELILGLAPATAASGVAGQVDAICEAVADFVDGKARATFRHSSLVAETAASIGGALGLSQGEQTRLRRAGLVHDVGKVGVPYGILVKATRGARLAEDEREKYRQHPYLTQRVLERVHPLQPLAEAAAAHHEWVNGKGYPTGLRGPQIALHGRILAVANAYAHQVALALPPERAAERLRPLVGEQFDADCYEALRLAVQGDGPPPAAAARRSEALTAREIEVMALVAQGLNNSRVAAALSISRKTVEHHLEHIYGKIGVTCRTAAVAYALQERLI